MQTTRAPPLSIPLHTPCYPQLLIALQECKVKWQLLVWHPLNTTLNDCCRYCWEQSHIDNTTVVKPLMMIGNIIVDKRVIIFSLLRHIFPISHIRDPSDHHHHGSGSDMNHQHHHHHHHHAYRNGSGSDMNRPKQFKGGGGNQQSWSALLAATIIIIIIIISLAIWFHF